MENDFGNRRRRDSRTGFVNNLIDPPIGDYPIARPALLLSKEDEAEIIQSSERLSAEDVQRIQDSELDTSFGPDR